MSELLEGISSLDQAADTSTRVKNRNEMDREDFFKIMTLQLQQQDPMSPMESENFLNQLVSMQSLDTMQVLTDSLSGFVDNQSFTTASGLLGKEVVTSGQIPIHGLVDQVTREGEDVTIKVAIPREDQTIASILGKDAVTKNDEGNFVTGTIKDVTFKNGQPHLVLTDGLLGSDDVLIPYDAEHVLKITASVKFDDIAEIGEPTELGDLEE